MSAAGAPHWKRSFRALNLSQLLGALNDNLFKQTIVLLAAAAPGQPTFTNADVFAWIDFEPKALVALVFSLPFILLGPLGGTLADRVAKPRSIRILKVTEVVLMALGGLAFLSGNAGYLLVLLFLMGVQSAFFGPNKYGVMPELLPEREMSRGNAVIQGTTYVAIIAGTVVAGQFLATFGSAFAWMGVGCVFVSVAGWFVSRRIEPLPPANPARPLEFNPFRGVFRDLRDGAKDKELLIAIFLGGLYLHVAGILVLAIIEYAQTLAFESALAGASWMQGVLIVGLVGGSLIVHRASRDTVKPGLSVIGLAGVAVTIAALALPFEQPLGPLLLLGCAGAFAGVFLVPQRTLVQLRPAAHEKGRYMGTAQFVDFAALLLASVAYDVLELRIGLAPGAIMLVIGALAALGGTLLFGLSGLYLQGVPQLFRRTSPGSEDARP